MLTRAGFTLLGAAGTLLVAGLAAGNFYYATLALVPLGTLLVALATDPAHRVDATVSVDRADPHAGDEVAVEVRYAVRDGTGPVELHVPLPDAFELASGSNVHVAVKRAREALGGTFAFTVRASARGEHELGPVNVEAVHPTGLRAPVTGTAGAPVALHVRPQDPGVRRARALSGFARTLFPDNDHSVTGVRTTEFRELREYAFGDPIKFINWKATARRVATRRNPNVTPLVNENEREGKQAVWLFLDAAPYMDVGTNAESAFDHAVSAALGVTHHFLERGYRLGAYVYNHENQHFLHPDVGRRQLLQLTRVLTTLAPGKDADEGLYGAVDRAKPFLVRDRPLIVVVTRLAKADERTFQALRRIRGMTGRRRRHIPVLIVNPVAASAIPADAAYKADVVRLMRRYERPAIDRARRIGARVVEWDPESQHLATLLAAHGRGRA